MLESLDGKEITDIPKSHKKYWEIWRGRLADQEFETICDEIDKKIDTDLISGTEVQVAGWIPGSDWTNTPYDPIWSKACLKNFQRK